MSKCKNCQWYGKPYWSIINPCDTCSNENKYYHIYMSTRGYGKTNYELQQENKRLKDKLNKIENNLNLSIYGITNKLITNKLMPIVVDGKNMYLNKYQIVRLKGIRTKCKELLRIIEGESDEK